MVFSHVDELATVERRDHLVHAAECNRQRRSPRRTHSVAVHLDAQRGADRNPRTALPGLDGRRDEPAVVPLIVVEPQAPAEVVEPRAAVPAAAKGRVHRRAGDR
ncbi:MAG: hypothetical protein ABIT71_20870, partial [Vicinamibacteraceae bacterium]